MAITAMLKSMNQTTNHNLFKLMIISITFEPRSRGNSEIQLHHDSGDTTILYFMSTFPIKAKEWYEYFIKEDLKTNPNLFCNDGLTISNHYERLFLDAQLERPIMVATYHDGERKRIGKRIRDIREELHLEARQLASMTGIDAASISRIEQGKHSVGIDILSKIANALGYRIDLIKNINMKKLSIKCGKVSDSIETLKRICDIEATKLKNELVIENGKSLTVPFWTSDVQELICTGVFKNNGNGEITYELDFSNTTL